MSLALSGPRRKYGITLIILDSLTLGSFRIDPGQAKDEIGLLKSLEPLGIVLAVDHTRKPQPSERTSELRAFGIALKGHFVRSQIHVLQHEAGVLELRHTKANFSDKQASILVELRFDSDDESGCRTVRVSAVRPGDERLAGADLPAIEKVFQAVVHFEDGVNIGQLAEVLDGMKDKTIRNHLSQLKGAGRIVRPEQGKWNLHPTANQFPTSQ